MAAAMIARIFLFNNNQWLGLFFAGRIGCCRVSGMRNAFSKGKKFYWRESLGWRSPLRLCESLGAAEKREKRHDDARIRNA
jgi:hypothetical protein